MTPAPNDPAVVLDANILIAICANELGIYPVAVASLRRYTDAGYVLHAPNAVVAECLYVLCNKLRDGFLTPQSHAKAIQDLDKLMQGVFAPPNGDKMLLLRTEQIRGAYGCSHSADGLYLAFTESLLQTGPAELLTFDAGLQRQAAVMTPQLNVRLLAP